MKNLKLLTSAALILALTACGKNTDYEKALQARKERAEQEHKARGGREAQPAPAKTEKPDTTGEVKPNSPAPAPNELPSKLTAEQKARFLTVIGAIGTVNNAIAQSQIKDPKQQDQTNDSLGANPAKIAELAKKLRADCNITKKAEDAVVEPGKKGDINGSLLVSYGGGACPVQGHENSVTKGSYDNTAVPGKVESSIETQRSYVVIDAKTLELYGVSDSKGKALVTGKVQSTKEKLTAEAKIEGTSQYKLSDGSLVTETSSGQVAYVYTEKTRERAGKVSVTYEIPAQKAAAGEIPGFKAVLEIVVATVNGKITTKNYVNGEEVAPNITAESLVSDAAISQALFAD